MWKEPTKARVAENPWTEREIFFRFTRAEDPKHITEILSELTGKLEIEIIDIIEKQGGMVCDKAKKRAQKQYDKLYNNKKKA